jgi:GT2 family glycosyltransferase
MTDIQIIIPWGQNKDLGAHYNRLMESVNDWVCFLDHDILMLNPNWYRMCLNAVDRLGHKAGWITGKTNAIACPYQLDQTAPKNNDIVDHMRHARLLYDKHQNKIELIDFNTISFYFSGFMILTHKRAWGEAGGFPEGGFLGTDNEYHKKLIQSKYESYVMPGLYMYHLYHTKRFWTTF